MDGSVTKQFHMGGKACLRFLTMTPRPALHIIRWFLHP